MGVGTYTLLNWSIKQSLVGIYLYMFPLQTFQVHFIFTGNLFKYRQTFEHSWIWNQRMFCWDKCPAGKTPYFESGTNKARPCDARYAQSNSVCPAGFSCDAVSAGLSLCCGHGPDLCPAGHVADSDRAGRLLFCAPHALRDACPPDSACVASSDQRSYLCCRRLGSSHCPGAGAGAGDVLYCDPHSPRSCLRSGTVCLQSRMDRRIHVCCPQSCPDGYALARAGPVECVNSNDCPPSSVCLESVTDRQKVCCERDGPGGDVGLASAHCPPAAGLSNRQLTMCSGGRKCPFGSYCLSSRVNPTLSICCNFDKTSVLCPQGFFSAQMSFPEQCVARGMSSCGLDEVCVESTGISGLQICCKKLSVNRPMVAMTEECPAGYLLLDNTVFYCDRSPEMCLARGAKCLPSLLTNRDVCCASRNAGNGRYSCPRGMSAHLSGDRSYFFCSSSMECPQNTICQQATNENSVKICCSSLWSHLSATCLQPTTIVCNPALRSGCPRGQRCSYVPARRRFMCCQNALSADVFCPDGNRPYLDQTLHPVECPAGSHHVCPSGTTCQKSKNSVITNLCCYGNGFTCPAMFQVDLSHNSQICSDQTCSPPNMCLPAKETPTNVICCKPIDEHLICPTGNAPVLKAGYYKECSEDKHMDCGAQAQFCHFSPALGRNLCCKRSGDAYDYTEICLLNHQSLYVSGKLQYCSQPGSYCDNGVECVYSKNINRDVCCRQESSVGNDWRCVSGRSPYPSRSDPTVCNPLSPQCPVGTACELSSQPDQYVCCDLDFRKPQCPHNWSPLYDGPLVRKCKHDSADESVCPRGFHCLPSDISNIGVCCRFSDSVKCRGGQEPLLSNHNPVNCTANADICPVGHVCVPSIDHSTMLCCKRAPNLHMDWEQCPDRTSVYRDPDQGAVVHCETDDDCPRQYTCHGRAVCCSALSSTSPCREGQLPELALGRPKACRVSEPTACGAGFMCQRGAATTAYFCCKRPQCLAGRALLDTAGRPVYCNPAAPLRCWADASCQEAVNMRGNYVCCLPADRQAATADLNRCVGRTTHLSAGRPLGCRVPGGHACPSGGTEVRGVRVQFW